MAATEAFLERGFEQTSLSDILARSGGSRRMIYEQFSDKEGLFEAIIVQQCATMLTPLDDPRLRAGEPEPMLRDIAQCFQDVMTSHTVSAVRRIIMGEGARFPRIVEIFFRSGVDPAIAQVATAFELLNERGMRFNEPELFAVMFLSMVQGDAVDRLTARTTDTRSPQALARQIDFAVETVLQAGRWRE